MSGILKLKVLIWCVTLSSLVACTPSNQSTEKSKDSWTQFSGNTQGTTYTLTFENASKKVTQEAIDSILHVFDGALSSYVDSSIISRINNAQDSIRIKDGSGYFTRCYVMSQKYYSTSNGAFDPSVYPLVKAWGFFGDALNEQSDADVAAILNYVGFEDGVLHKLLSLGPQEFIFYKYNNNFQLDFNAVAQGYSVDILAAYLDECGVKNYYVEIGGEIAVKGTNKEGNKWRIGVDSPHQKEGTRVIENVVHVTNRGIATSGNYRKFYEKDGVRYAHTIDPKTGKPVQHSLLSATVIANTCAEADAYATAFMVMGTEKAVKFVEEHPELNLEIYLLEDIKGEIKRTMSPGFKKYLK